MKQKILDQLNKIIVDEKGIPVTMKSMFMDSELDSLGVMLTLVMLETDYPIFRGIATEDELAYLDIPNLTVRDLIKKCVSSITPTLPGLIKGKVT
jgi:hypothetical protein